MTETSTFESGPADPGLDMVPPDVDSGEASSADDNRRRMIIIGIVAGVIVLAAAAFLLLHKSGGSSTASGLVPHGNPTAPAGGQGGSNPNGSGSPTSTGKSGHGPKTLPKVVHHPTVRDPFAPLITAPMQTNSNPASTTNVQAAPTASAAATTPTSTTTSTTVPASGTTKTTGNGTTSGDPQWIQLESTKGTTKATFKVGYAGGKYRVYVVQAPKATSTTGTVFDTEFALIGVQHGSATIQIGDATPFDLPTGVAHKV